jgi:CheY-like chemotaxis protein
MTAVDDPPPQVLVVEDDSPIRTMLTDLLEDAGYSVTAADDGLQALEYLRHLRPHLIVLDLMMPGLSGWQLLERSRVQLTHDNIPVIVLSAIRGESDYPATMGVAAWFTKPLDVPRFLTAVDQLAGGASADRAEAEPRASTERAHILVIEDDAPISTVVSEHLEQEGYSHATAASIEEAEDRLSEQGPGADPARPDAAGPERLDVSARAAASARAGGHSSHRDLGCAA